jgi:hypothetical protein
MVNSGGGIDRWTYGHIWGAGGKRTDGRHTGIIAGRRDTGIAFFLGEPLLLSGEMRNCPPNETKN